MAQILVQVPDKLLRELDGVAPASSRKRSKFIRLALQRALMELRDLETQRAYSEMPDDEPEWFDPRTWGEWNPRATRRRTRRKTRA
jgi:hypothetical protein